MIRAVGAEGEGSLIQGWNWPLVCPALFGVLQWNIEAGGLIKVIDRQPAASAQSPTANRVVRASFTVYGADVFPTERRIPTQVAKTAVCSASHRHESAPLYCFGVGRPGTASFSIHLALRCDGAHLGVPV